MDWPGDTSASDRERLCRILDCVLRHLGRSDYPVRNRRPDPKCLRCEWGSSAPAPEAGPRPGTDPAAVGPGHCGWLLAALAAAGPGAVHPGARHVVAEGGVLPGLLPVDRLRRAQPLDAGPAAAVPAHPVRPAGAAERGAPLWEPAGGQGAQPGVAGGGATAPAEAAIPQEPGAGRVKGGGWSLPPHYGLSQPPWPSERAQGACLLMGTHSPSTLCMLLRPTHPMALLRPLPSVHTDRPHPVQGLSQAPPLPHTNLHTPPLPKAFAGPLMPTPKTIKAHRELSQVGTEFVGEGAVSPVLQLPTPAISHRLAAVGLISLELKGAALMLVKAGTKRGFGLRC